MRRSTIQPRRSSLTEFDAKDMQIKNFSGVPKDTTKEVESYSSEDSDGEMMEQKEKEDHHAD